jgi:hypothetical protein
LETLPVQNLAATTPTDFAGAYAFKGTRGKVVDVRPGPGGMKPPACLAVSRSGSHLLAAAGGRCTLSSLLTSKVSASVSIKHMQSMC